MSDELKPCPFCGGKAEIAILDRAYYKHTVICTGCGVVVRGTACQNDIFNVTTWNTRLPSTCDTCDFWDNSPWQLSPETRLCFYLEKRSEAETWGFVNDCGPKFGCIHHSPKGKSNGKED